MRGAASTRDRVREKLADLKLPGALEAVDEILSRVDGGALGVAEAIEELLEGVSGIPCISPFPAHPRGGENFSVS